MIKDMFDYSRYTKVTKKMPEKVGVSRKTVNVMKDLDMSGNPNRITNNSDSYT